MLLDGILAQGLIRRSRNHAHLSSDIETARKVGGQRGKPVVLSIYSAKMRNDAHAFYRSKSGAWLTEAAPLSFIGYSE